jgi:hypothetical protein
VQVGGEVDPRGRRAVRGGGCIALGLVVATAAALGGQAPPSSTPGPGRDGRAPASTGPDATGDSLRFDGAAGQLDVRVPRFVDPGIRIDGRLDEATWAQAALLTGFTQYQPTEGVPAVEPTEVLVFYAPDAIYFGIRAFDSQPSTIPAQLGQRDRGIFSDDWVRITLDTFNDERQAYLFYVNPLGIQADGLWIEGKPSQFRGGPPVELDPDFIWDSDGHVTEDGWVAEVRIPYISLQFAQADEQVWRLNVAREVRRLGYEQSWAPLTANQTSTLAQSGRLLGMSGLNPKKLLEINPVLTGKLTGEEVDGVFGRGSVEPEFGLDGRYGITRNLSLGATVNPDFSQVEADADQIAVNERFALFFSEKRPFFLDGTEIFQSPTRLVHTRQIIDPSGGAKLTGKIGGLSLAYLGALDDSPVSLDDGENRALFNLARVRADVGAGSAIGLLYTDRSMIGEATYNRVASADARLLFGRSLSLTTQVAGSWTREASEGDSVADAGSEFGALWYASLRQSGRSFEWQLTAEDVGTDFLTETGFIRRVGDIRTFASAQVNLFTPPGSNLQSIGFETRFEGFFNHANFWSGERMSPFEREVEVETTLSFRGNRSITFTGRNGYFRFRPEDYEDYEVELRDGTREPFTIPEPLANMWAGAVRTRYRVSSAVQLNGSALVREVPIFGEASRGLELRISPSIDLRPTASWQMNLSYTLSRLRRQEDHTFFSSADIPRLRTQYQFSKALFARVIFQYDLAEREARRDPTTGRPLVIDDELSVDEQRGRFLTQILVSYEPSPRTVFFLGWSRQMEGDRTFRLSEMDPINEGFFAKLGYLYRF